MKRLLLLFFIVTGFYAQSQVAVNSTGSAADGSAMLDVSSNDKGILIPRMTLAGRIAISNPATGLMIYQTDNSPGFYYNSGTGGNPVWKRMDAGNSWGLDGNSGTVAGTNFIGTTDNVPLIFRVSNNLSGRIDNTQSLTSFGYFALSSNTTGNSNTAFGFESLASNTSGSQNTASGAYALYFNSFGLGNSAAGYMALYNNTRSSLNTAFGNLALSTQSYDPDIPYVGANVAVGAGALYYNQPTSTSNGIDNSAIGYVAMYNNETGYSNTSVGRSSMYSNISGANNCAFGASSLYNNTFGHSNIAIGLQSSFNNTIADSNIAIGSHALYSNTALNKNIAIGHNALRTQSYNPGVPWESYNTAIGFGALYSNQPTGTDNGQYNTAVGGLSLYNNTTGTDNTAMGITSLYSNTTGSQNVALGDAALFNNTSGSYNTAIGHLALFAQSYNPGDDFHQTFNTAIGAFALSENEPTSVDNGIFNTAIGAYSIAQNLTGNNNTAVGSYSMFNTLIGWQNTAIGANSMVYNYIGSYHTAVGYNTGPNADNLYNTTCIGVDAIADASDMVRIGNVYVGSIGGYQSWTNISDGRFKTDVTDNVPGLEFISQLRPVTYRLNRDEINEFTGVNARRDQLRAENPEMEFLSGERYSQVTTGFIAQEVEAAAQSIGFEFSGVDAPDNPKDLYGLRYAEFVVPLVKAIQEQQEQIEQLKAHNAGLETRLAEMERKLAGN